MVKTPMYAVKLLYDSGDSVRVVVTWRDGTKLFALLDTVGYAYVVDHFRAVIRVERPNVATVHLYDGPERRDGSDHVFNTYDAAAHELMGKGWTFED